VKYGNCWLIIILVIFTQSVAQNFVKVAQLQVVYGQMMPLMLADTGELLPLGQFNEDLSFALSQDVKVFKIIHCGLPYMEFDFFDSFPWEERHDYVVEALSNIMDFLTLDRKLRKGRTAFTTIEIDSSGYKTISIYLYSDFGKNDHPNFGGFPMVQNCGG
jgi:hypothetical protein